eukprot:6213937-Pleurochrysis_carterae.AAC.5
MPCCGRDHPLSIWPPAADKSCAGSYRRRLTALDNQFGQSQLSGCMRPSWCALAQFLLQRTAVIYLHYVAYNDYTR